MNPQLRRLLLVLALLGVVAAAWFRPLDPIATRQIDAGLKRALLSFATARALNSIISVVQGTEFAVEPGGVGVNFAVGQALRPINDMVSQFAELMLAASVAFGVMKVMVGIGGYWMISVFLSLVALGWAWLRWRGGPAPGWLSRLLFVLLLVRFGVPLVAVGSDALFHQFLDDDYTASQNALDGSTAKLAALNPSTSETPPDAGIRERIAGWWSSNVDVSGRVEKLKQLAGLMTEHFVRLIVVFLMQTLVIPLFLFWVLYRAGRSVFDPPPRG